MFRNFIEELNGKGVEGELVKTIFYSLLTSFLTLIVLYFVRLRNVGDFFSKHGFFIFFAVLSYAIIIPAIRQVRAYKEFPCMSGMMIGMTTGMFAGFLPGFYVASTNGMFIGGFFGVTMGIISGVWNGKCCGVMGIMEGIMAGFMGGLMGAMTAFMLFNDHLKTTAIIVFLISLVIMTGLNYMIYLESKQIKRQHKEDQILTIALSFLLTVITTWLIVFGPRSAIFG